MGEIVAAEVIGQALAARPAIAGLCGPDPTVKADTVTIKEQNGWFGPLFWFVAGSELFLALCGLLMVATSPRGHGFIDLSGLLIASFRAIAVVLAIVMLVFARSRGRVLRWLMMGIVVSPPVCFAAWWIRASAAIPSAVSMKAGHGYFQEKVERMLADAIVAGDAEAVMALAPKANIDVAGYAGMTFLRLALSQDEVRPPVIAALLRAGATSDRLDVAEYIERRRDEPLLHAVCDKDVPFAISNRGGQPWFFDVLGWSAGLTFILEHCADIEAKDLSGDTAIMHAVIIGAWPGIDVLLAHGARLDHVGGRGGSLRDMVQQKVKTYQEEHRVMPAQLLTLAKRVDPPIAP